MESISTCVKSIMLNMESTVRNVMTNVDVVNVFFIYF
jgi:hypothetical protein